MRKTTLFIIIGLISFVSCKKNSGNAASEIQLQIALDPDPGSAVAYASSNQYAFGVKITSSLPTAGVTVALKTTKDSDNSTIDSKSVQASTTTIGLTTGDIMSGNAYTVAITVTSNSKPSNTATKSFKVSRK